MRKIVSFHCHQPVYLQELKNAPRNSFGRWAKEKDCENVELTDYEDCVIVRFPGSTFEHQVPKANIKQVTFELSSDNAEKSTPGSGQAITPTESVPGIVDPNAGVQKAKRGPGRKIAPIQGN